MKMSGIDERKKSKQSDETKMNEIKMNYGLVASP